MKIYGDGRIALRGVDLTIGQGMLGVLGPNGAGKTTLLSILVLAREPTEGTLDYGGLSSARPSDYARIRQLIGYLPQDFQPLSGLTGREYVTHCAILRNAHTSSRSLTARVNDVLQHVGLDRVADRCARDYSGGMKRRLGIAQAIVHSPQLLVVDEPTAGLDPEERIRFRNLVTDLAEDCAVVLSTHIVEDVEATCPRLVVVGFGRVLFDGEPTDLMHRCIGRLYELPASAPLPDGCLEIGRCISTDGRTVCVLADCEVPPRQGLGREPTLESAYASFLARHAHGDADTTRSPRP